MRVESIDVAEDLLRVRCSGTVAIGTESIASMRPVADALTAWMSEHPDHPVRVISVDFREVDYRWGDAPVSSLLPFVRQGVQQFVYLASRKSAPALETLISIANMPWFSVERQDVRKDIE